MSQTAQKRIIGRHACERCRRAKIRCLTDALESNNKCRKCLAGGLDCEWKEISKKRVRKQTNARIVDLERQLLSLTAVINDARNGASPGRVSACQDEVDLQLQTPSETVTDAGHAAGDNVGDDSFHGSAPPAGNHHGPTRNHTSLVLASDSTSLPFKSFSAETRTQLLKKFVKAMLPQYPVISIPENTPLEELEETKPFMVNAVIASACSISEPTMFRAMHEDNVALLSQAVIVQGRKSIDLLQALLVTATWACPPEDLSNLNIYQWSHMACTMALELGLGGKSSLHAQAQCVEDFAKNPSETMMDRYRTMFGVYLTCSRLAVSFRRQRIISFSASTDSIIEIFLQSAQNSNDRRLVAWLRLQLIAEDIENMKQSAEMGLESSFMEATSLKSNFSLLHDRLRSWENALDPTLWIESLKIDFGLCRIKLHELTVYCGENIHQLDLSSLATQSQGPTPKPHTTMNPRQTRALFSVIEGCQSILEVFLHADLETIRVLPTLTVFRVPLAFKALAMLKKRMENPNELINLIIDDQTLAWDHYSGKISKVLDMASANRLYAYPSLALQIRDLILVSKRPDSESHHSLSNYQTTGITTGLHTALGHTASLAESNNEFINNLTMSFYPTQDETAAWPTDFLHLAFGSV